jgi:CelD/BcsL family acetyltransferase involved in cellulose biosynthesis
MVQNIREFEALEEEWEDLYHESSIATPFQSWAWLYSWWQSYGEGYELRLLTMRDDAGLLVGIMPLMLERKLGLRRLLFIGTGQTDYLGVLVRGAGKMKSSRTECEHSDEWAVGRLQISSRCVRMLQPGRSSAGGRDLGPMYGRRAAR